MAKTDKAIARDCTYYYGETVAQVRERFEAEIADREADRKARFEANSIAIAMRDGYRAGLNSGNVGELDTEETRSSWASLDTDLENVGRDHSTMGVSWREITVGTSQVVITCEVHGQPNPEGDMVAKAVLFRIASSEGVTPTYGLRYKVAHELIHSGIITRNMALAMVQEASHVGGFEPVAIATWLRTSEVASQERHGMKTPTTSWASVKVAR